MVSNRHWLVLWVSPFVRASLDNRRQHEFRITMDGRKNVALADAAREPYDDQNSPVEPET